MIRIPLRAGCAIAVGVALLWPYLAYLGFLLFGRVLFLASLAEAAIVALLLARVLAFTLHPRLRYARFEVVLGAFSVEAFVVVALFGAYVLTANNFYLNLFTEFASIWLVALPSVTLPYAFFRYLVTMVKGSNLVNVVAVGVVEFGLALFLSSLVPSSGAQPESLTAFATSVTANLKSSVSAGGGYLFAPNSTPTGPAMLFFVGLILYAVIPGRVSAPELPKSLAICLASTVAVALTVFSAGQGPTMLLSMTVATFIIASATWWLSRAR